MDEHKKAYLRAIYYDPSHLASYSGVNNLYKEIKREGRFNITFKELKEWLKTQETYGVHRQRRVHFPRPMVVVSGVGFQADADLMDMSQLADYNDGVKNILLYIDDFSKVVHTVPLRSKTGKEVAEAFKTIYQELEPTQALRTDGGAEFTNRTVQNVFKEAGVKHIVTRNEPKSLIAERGIKSLKSKYFKYMNQKQTFRYIDIIDDITHAYNHRYHRAIKMRPVDVTSENEAEEWNNLYRKKREKN